jgi:hypothetical protein
LGVYDTGYGQRHFGLSHVAYPNVLAISAQYELLSRISGTSCSSYFNSV